MGLVLFDQFDGTGATINLTAYEQNDLALIINLARNTDSVAYPASVTPSGFTVLAEDISDDGAAGYRSIASYKVLTGSETNVTGMSDNEADYYVFIFRPSRPITTITPSTWLHVNQSNNPAAQVIAAAGVEAALIAFAFAAKTNGTTAVAFVTETPAFFASVAVNTTNTEGRYGYTVYNKGEAPVDHTVDMNDAGENYFLSGYLRVA